MSSFSAFVAVGGLVEPMMIALMAYELYNPSTTFAGRRFVKKNELYKWG